MITFNKKYLCKSLFLSAYALLDIIKYIAIGDTLNKRLGIIDIENFYAPLTCMIFFIILFCIKCNRYTLNEFLSGIVLGLLEYFITSETAYKELVPIVIKFFESLTVIQLLMLSEILIGKRKALERNITISILFILVSFCFSIKEMIDFDYSIFKCFIFIFPITCNIILKHLFYVSKSSGVVITSNNIRALLFLKKLYEMQSNSNNIVEVMAISLWSTQKILVILYFFLQCSYILIEYYCFKYINLDEILLWKTISMQIIIIYKKVFIKYNY